MPPQKVWFLGLFDLKTGKHFAYFGLESGMVFEGTTGVYERTVKIPKISPGAYCFQRPLLRGLFLEGLIYGGKFAFKID